MSKQEQLWDKSLGIKTTGRDDYLSDEFNYPYEPTPYSVLERVAQAGMIGKDNCVLDYGCGKGRVSFFFAQQTRCRAIGIEYNQRVYDIAMENKRTSPAGQSVNFHLGKAEDFAVPTNVDRCFFFNPFSEEILRQVLVRITESYWEEPREIILFFYFPSYEFTVLLKSMDQFEACEPIDCSDLFPANGPRERVAIYKLSASF